MNKKTGFLSSKQSLKANKIYVYCPEAKVKELESAFEGFDCNFIINPNKIDKFNRVVVTHFGIDDLCSEKEQFLVDIMEKGAWVEPLISYLDRRFGFTEVSLLSSSYFLHQKAFSILSTKRTQIAKRIIDIVFAIFLLVVTLPITILTAIAISLESKGPVFYKQLRTGQYNKEFYVFKFRSMSTDAESGGAQWAKKNDSRVTKVGKFIRKTRIDELPQLINVLKGEMSMVGPRPEREIFIDTLEKEIKYYRFRHAVKPGVTGLAQVSYPYGASIEDAIWKHKYDLHYIKHHSTVSDLVILLKTIKVVIFGMGR